MTVGGAQAAQTPDLALDIPQAEQPAGKAKPIPADREDTVLLSIQAQAYQLFSDGALVTAISDHLKLPVTSVDSAIQWES